MKAPSRRPGSGRPNLKSLTVIAVLLAIVALIGIPLFSSSMASSSSNIIQPKNGLEATGQSSERIVERVSKLESLWAAPGLAAPARTRSWFSASPSMALAGETVELFASDCTTPKTAFTLGETVCAKTNGVDVTANPGNFYMNWVDSMVNQTNGGTITQNPQFFLFVPPTAGLWKATIGSLSPADSSIISVPPEFTVSNGPGISTYTPDCLTPKTTFTLSTVTQNEVVCATAAGTGGAAARRRVIWIGPGGNVRQVNDITTDPESFSFTIPSTQTSIVGGEIVDNRGNWKVNIVSLKSSVVATTTFVVTDPAAPTADLSAVKFAESSSVSAGSNTKFFISVYNNGPNAAVNAVLNDPLPANTTFYSITKSPGSGFTCTTPDIGSAGTVNCTIASLPRDTTAQFELTVQIASGAAVNSVITNTATVSSGTADANSDNNSSSASVTVSGGGGGGGDCTVACPADIKTPANTVDEELNPGAVVHFSPPSGNEECGNITVDHCNDCFFPEGDTVVTATSPSTGESCSFTVTVTGATTISCPPNKTADAGANCDAQVDPGTPTATGTNVTISGVRSDGRPLNARYPVGTTTIAWTATSHDAQGEETGNASCTQTIEVTGAEDTTPPTVTAPADSSSSADSTCQAAIPDYAAGSTASDNCGSTPTLTQSPEAGTLVGTGPHTVTVTATDDAGNQSSDDVVFTVNDTTPPAITCPLNVVTPTDSGSCSATVNPGTATATDNCDSSPTIVGTRSDSQALNAPYPKGTTTITWRATDDAGNYSECSQTVTVNDEEPPTISCPANITVYVAPNSSDTSAIVTYTAPVGSDNCAGSTTTQTAGLSSGASFPVGSTTNTFRVTDASGNYTECSFTVTVLYNFTGFFSPVNNPPVFNNVNAGRTIPIKFSLSGNKGLGIFAAGYPVSQQIACDTSAPLADVEGTNTSGGSTLTYSPDQYHYNWKTESSWAGTCRVLTVKLNDGTEHTALFKFK